MVRQPPVIKEGGKIYARYHSNSQVKAVCVNGSAACRKAGLDRGA